MSLDIGQVLLNFFFAGSELQTAIKVRYSRRRQADFFGNTRDHGRLVVDALEKTANRCRVCDKIN